MSFTIDGIKWDYPCQIERVSEMTASEISGLMLDKSYFNDVLGTWLKYSLTIAVPFGSETDYNAIYEQLTQPVAGHEFILPYGNSTISITGRVASVLDAWIKMPGNANYWRGKQFEILSNNPTKTEELGEVLVRGNSPIPAIPWSGWVKFQIDDDGYLHLIKTEGLDIDFYIDDDGNLHSLALGDVIEYTAAGWDRVAAADGDNIYF